MKTRHPPTRWTRQFAVLTISCLLLVSPAGLSAQQAPQADNATMDMTSRAQPEMIMVASGHSAVMRHQSDIKRVSITNSDIADVNVVSAREVVIYGKQPGATSLLVWTNGHRQRHYSYTVHVPADVAALEAALQNFFPDDSVQARAVGNTIYLNGYARTPRARTRIVDLAEKFGPNMSVLEDIRTADEGQILLKVRFAEVSRSSLEQLGLNLMRMDPDNPRGDDEGALSPGAGRPFGGNFLDGSGPDQTFSDAVNLFLFHDASNIGAFLQALKDKGIFRSLAEPNLMTLPGEEASFLAGGEFPYPVVQGSGGRDAVTIQFKEFGVRLKFLPTITDNGRIRLQVAPEVSSLDFSGGLESSGFRIPALLSRRAETAVELGHGQTFAIAGLIDDKLVENSSKVPILGDIPILGALFSSKEMRKNRTELLVLVTPYVIYPGQTAQELMQGYPMLQKEFGADSTDTTATP